MEPCIFQLKTANYRAVPTLEVRRLLQMAGDWVSVKIDASSFKPTVIHLPEATTSPRLRVDLIKQSFHFVLMRQLWRKEQKFFFLFNPRQRVHTLSPKDIDCLTEWQICFHSDEIRQIYLIGQMISNIWGNNGRACIWWFLMLSPDWMRQSR